MKCTHFQHIDIENVKSDSECRGIDTTNATARLKELCDDKRTCSPDTDYDSSLYHERFVSFSYGCTGKDNLSFLLNKHVSNCDITHE